MNFDAFIGGSYQSQAATADCEETVNFYVENLQSPGATAKRALYPTPGVTTLATGTSGAGRAHFFQAGREFAIIGNTLYEIDVLGTLTSRGTVADDSKPATISGNGASGKQLFITSGLSGYVYDLTLNTLTEIAALYGVASAGGFLDGFFLCLDTKNNKFYTSALFNGASWTPGTNFARRSLGADPWLAMKVVGRLIWLLGATTSELWYNAGTSPFPMAPYSTGLVNVGIVAPDSACVVGPELLWLGLLGGGRISPVRATGPTPEIISTQPLETAIGGYRQPELAIGDAYAADGHVFYLLHFDLDGVTWAWDPGTRLWAKRGAWNTTRGAYDAWRPRYHQLAYGEHRTLDAADANLLQLSTSSTVDVDGSQIRRVRRAPAITNENKRVFYSSLELDVEPGLGNTVDPGSNPHVTLRVSNDAGKTWATEPMRPTGMRGEYQKRVRWNRLGSARRRVFEVVVMDPIPWRITGAYLGLAS